MDGVKNLVVQKNVIKKKRIQNYETFVTFFVLKQKFPITRIADNLIEQKSSPETDDYRYFDPKLIKNDGYIQLNVIIIHIFSRNFDLKFKFAYKNTC